MTAPFQYPLQPHQRIHGPRGYTRYESYRPCYVTNSRFGASIASFARPDPLTTLTDSQVEVAADGTLVTHSPEAAKLAELLGRNRPRLCEFRELWIGIVRLAASCDTSLLQLLLGYPTDLPNLSMLRPPEGNSRPEGVAQSHFSRRRQGELPDLYWLAMPCTLESTNSRERSAQVRMKAREPRAWAFDAHPTTTLSVVPKAIPPSGTLVQTAGPRRRADNTQ
jgi:hypothetical protein